MGNIFIKSGQNVLAFNARRDIFVDMSTQIASNTRAYHGTTRLPSLSENWSRIDVIVPTWIKLDFVIRFLN